MYNPLTDQIDDYLLENDIEFDNRKYNLKKYPYKNKINFRDDTESDLSKSYYNNKLYFKAQLNVD